MKKTILLVAFGLSTIFSIAQDATKYADPKEKTITGTTSARYDFKIIDAPNNTHGYDIYADDVLKIHQPSIPGMQGNDGFKTKMDAQKVAKFAISKIGKGEMPPTITLDDLKKLNVLK